MSSETNTIAAVGGADPRPAGSAAGLIAAVAAGHCAVAGFVTGGVVAFAAVVALMRFQNSARRQIRQHPYFDCLRVAVPQAGNKARAR